MKTQGEKAVKILGIVTSQFTAVLAKCFKCQDHSVRRGWANRKSLFNGIEYMIEVMKNSQDGLNREEEVSKERASELENRPTEMT